jgi:LPS-assembly protein
VQRWQTLKERLAPITAPYNRQPSLIFNALKQDVAGFDFNLHTSYVDFNHPTLANGRRVLAYPHLSLPLQTSYAYVTPKIGLHSTHYILDSTTTTLPDSSRHVPIGSVEGGLIFERETAIGGRGFVQTLEPKAYYVRIPTRNQNLIPNFESGLQDINFATIFSENQFSGQDRINDADQITVGVTSRLLARDTGAELIRAGIAQRYYFKSQEVTLPGTPPRDSLSSDLLATLSGNIARGWIAEAGWQFNTDRSETQKLSAGMRYQPAPGKVVNAGYRFTRNVLEQVEVSTQWPIAPQWTVLGRLNQSIRERRMLDSLLGFEYNASCWSLRVVASRVATTVTSASTAVFVQLELNGVSKVGSNPLSTLIQNISGYTPTGQSSPGQSTVNRSDVHYAR